MNIKKLLTITLICVGFAASADDQVVSQAYEVTLSDFRAPTTTNSGIAFKACTDCEQQRVRVTASTSYSINGERVRLEDFRKAATTAHDRDEKTVIVLHHLESDTVVSLDVSI
jgi:hypothetical protein